MDQNNSEQPKSPIRSEIKQQTIGYITSALGLVAGLAWNDAIKTLIQKVFPSSHNTIIAQFIYAVIVTLLVVLFSIYLYKIFKVEKK